MALANAGVALDGGTLGRVAGSRLTWAVAVGLVVGKLLGIGCTALLVVRLGLGRPPAGVGPGHLFGAGALGRIGFTVSLFVTGLAFPAEALQAEV